jgi:hypothetical protein
MRKFISLLLVFSILNISCATISPTYIETYPRKKGKDLIVHKADGHQVRGWLIAVKEDSLLLMERDSGRDVSINIEDVGAITIVKKSKFLLRAGLGFASYIVVSMGTEAWADVSNQPELKDQTALGLGLIAGLIGCIAGGSLVKDKTIQIEEKSDAEIKEILEKLRKKARIRNSQ